MADCHGYRCHIRKAVFHVLAIWTCHFDLEIITCTSHNLKLIQCTVNPCIVLSFKLQVRTLRIMRHAYSPTAPGSEQQQEFGTEPWDCTSRFGWLTCSVPSTSDVMTNVLSALGAFLISPTAKFAAATAFSSSCWTGVTPPGRRDKAAAIWPAVRTIRRPFMFTVKDDVITW